MKFEKMALEEPDEKVEEEIEQELSTQESVEFREMGEDFPRIFREKVSNLETAIGVGSKAVVFEGDHKHGERPECLKIIWQYMSIGIKPGNLNPDSVRYINNPYIESLKKIENFYDAVKSKQRGMVEAHNIDFRGQNSPIDETKAQHHAHQILEGVGLSGVIPKIFEAVEFEDRDESDDSDKDAIPYILSHKGVMLRMEQINGKSLEELILTYEEVDVDGNKFLKSFPFEEAREKLFEAINALHEARFFHGDISNRNIMIDFENKSFRIIDFGTSGVGKTHEDRPAERKELEKIMNLFERFLSDPKKTSKELEDRTKGSRIDI